MTPQESPNLSANNKAESLQDSRLVKNEKKISYFG